MDPVAELVERYKEGDASGLIKWYEDGADGQIDWCSPGDFDACVSIAKPHLDNPEGFCQERHISVCGGPAGSEDHSTGGRTAMKRARRTRDQIIGAFLVAAADAEAAGTQLDGAAFDAYPWQTCIDDQTARGNSQEDAEKICGAIKAENSSLAGGQALATGTATGTAAPAAPAVLATPEKPWAPAPYDATGEGTGEPVTCPACGKGDSTDAQFCDQCGYGLAGRTVKVTGVTTPSFKPKPDPGIADDDAIICPTCSKGDADDASFCDQCGFKLAGALGVKPTPSAEKAAADAAAAAPATPPATGTTSATPTGSSSTPTGATLAARSRAYADVPATGTAAAPPPSPGDAADAAVLKAVQQLQADVAAAVAAQAQDPDTTDPADKKVADLLSQATELATELVKAQSADTDTTTPDAAAASLVSRSLALSAQLRPSRPRLANGFALTALQVAQRFAPGRPTAPATGDVPGNAQGVPGDADDSPPATGDVTPNVACGNPNCNHLASGHLDVDTGENSGPCQMQGCTCPGMVPPANQVNGPGTSGASEGEGTPANAKAPDTTPEAHAAAGTQRFATPAAPAPAASTAEGPTPATPGTTPAPSALMGPAFTIPVGILEGVETSDGRQIAETALGWRNPPLPLMFLDTMTHDPMGFDQNDPAVLVGRIDYVERDPSNPKVIRAGGYFLATEDATEAAQKLEGMGRMGISADVGEAEVETSLPDLLGGPIELDDMLDVPIVATLVKGTIMGFTMCTQPAFAECFVVLGDHNFATALSAEDQADETASGAVAAAGRKITMPFHLVDQAECEPCTMASDPAIVAASAPAAPLAPLAPPSAWFTDPGFNPDDGRLREYLDPKTLRASGRYGCPTTVTDDGEVFGHLAVWGVCHTSPMYRGTCLLAPRSQSDYALWYRGQVRTAEGGLVDVGCLTAGVGHAPLSFSATAAAAHYDDTRYAVADVVVGEDEYGIWFHGALRPTATEQQVYVLRASTLSGDWRPIGTRQELVAALAVNSPGFPHVKAHRMKGKITALVSAGIPVWEAPPMPPPRELTAEERIARLEANAQALAPLAHARLVEQIGAMRRR